MFERTSGKNKIFINKLIQDLNNGEAKRFFSETKPKSIQPVTNLDDILKDNFIIGECHHNSSPKEFLILNMQRLKQAGFHTLFLEHFIYDDQEVYDQFYAGDPLATERMYQFSKNLDLDFYPLSCKNYNFTTLIEAAHHAKIRIVGIDTDHTYKEQNSPVHMEYAYGGRTGFPLDDYRIKSMNYTGYHIINKEMAGKPGKWFALMGNAHVKSYHKVTGLSELTGARFILILDNKSKNENTIAFNQAVVKDYPSSFCGAEEKVTFLPEVFIQHHTLPQFSCSQMHQYKL